MSPRERIACVEDADEYDNVIEGSSKYAASVASPTKEKPNTSRSRRTGSRRDSESPINGLTDSDSTAHPSVMRRDSRSKAPRDREKMASSSSSRKGVITVRPQPRHSNTAPASHRQSREAEASYFGVNPATITSASSRPRGHTTASRPVTYYAPRSRPAPPQSNASWYAQQAALPPTSYPPQSWASAGPNVYPTAAAGPMISQRYDQFSRPLEDRFGRPQSAFGYRGGYTNHEQENERPSAPARQASLHKKLFKNDIDSRAMPPPPRPASARPTTLAFRPPPSTPAPPARRSLVFDMDDLSGDSDLFRDISPQQPYLYGSDPIPRARSRRPSVGARSVTYDSGPFHTEIARRPSRNGRRDSFMANRGYEDKIREATAYQNDVSGAAIPLTAETLRKANKNSHSSRSTRSSGSHDESSEFRQSAPTRTTRSSAEEDVTTIRAKGNIKLKFGDAEMRCEDGAEISFSSSKMPGYRSGSDQSSYMDQEDRRTRAERPAARTRASSQAGSYSRSSYQAPVVPTYEYDPYYNQRAIPPYPAYPTQPTGDFF